MAASDGLGRVFNVIAVAKNVYVPMRAGTAVTFVCYNSAGDTYTVTEAKDGSGTSSQALAAVSRFYDSDGLGGAWSKVSQTAASTVVDDGTAGHDCSVFTVRSEQLSDNYTHLKCASTGSGTVVAILHELQVQRAPQNLPSLV